MCEQFSLLPCQDDGDHVPCSSSVTDERKGGGGRENLIE